MSKKVVIPFELKYEFIKGMLTTLFKGFMYAIREKYGTSAALEIYEVVCKMDERVKNMTNTLKDVFKIEGNDCEAIGKWWDIYWELTGMECTWLELSKTFSRVRITQCPFKTEPKDLSDWCVNILVNLITKTLNPEAILERFKAMCAGDPYCEFVTKMKE